MKKPEWNPEEKWNVNEWLNQNFGTINNEEVLRNIHDHRLETDEQAMQNIQANRTLHQIVTLWFSVDGLSNSRREQQGKWERHLYVLQGMLKNEPPKKMAAELKCHFTTIDRLGNEIRFVLSIFGVLMLELKDRLSDPMANSVLDRIKIGWDREKIIRQLEEDPNVVDRAYVTLRSTFLCILKDYKDMAKHNPEAILRLSETMRQIEK